MNQTIEIWRACGIGFFVGAFAFAVGFMIGKDIGWNQHRDFLRPRPSLRKKAQH